MKYTTAEYASGFDSLLGDFDLNAVLDANDLDLLGSELRNGGDNFTYDMNSDNAVDKLDRDFWVTELASTRLGDANLDQQVDFSDFLALSAGFGRSGGWANGDFDGSGDITFPDFLVLSANFGEPRIVTLDAVPEPSAVLLLLTGLVALTLSRRSMTY